MSDLQLQEATSHVVVVILVTLKLSRASTKVYESHKIGTSVSWERTDPRWCRTIDFQRLRFIKQDSCVRPPRIHVLRRVRRGFEGIFLLGWG